MTLEAISTSGEERAIEGEHEPLPHLTTDWARFEEHHGIQIEPDALKAAVDFSIRYTHDFRLPDNAIELVRSGVRDGDATPRSQSGCFGNASIAGKLCFAVRGWSEEWHAAPATRHAMELPPERYVPKAPLWERG